MLPVLVDLTSLDERSDSKLDVSKSDFAMMHPLEACSLFIIFCKQSPKHMVTEWEEMIEKRIHKED